MDEEGFIAAWREADDEHRLKEILLRRDRYATVSVLKRSPTESLIGRTIQEVEIPAECLVAIIRRKEQTIVPGGQTVVQEGDRLTIIGSAKGIRQVYEIYGSEGAAPAV